MRIQVGERHVSFEIDLLASDFRESPGGDAGDI